MSYAGPASRNRGQSQGQSSIGQRTLPQPTASESAARDRPGHGEADESRGRGETDWQQLAIFGAGLALGLALGAGAALLTAPQTGEETRAALRGRVRRIKRTTARRGRDAWSELGDELRGATASLRRRRAKRRFQHELDREAAAD